MVKRCDNRELNKPWKSNRKFKKKQVCVKDLQDKIRNIHYGDIKYEDYTQHKDKKRRANFRARHKCDELTKKDKATPRWGNIYKSHILNDQVVVNFTGVAPSTDFNVTIKYLTNVAN